MADVLPVKESYEIWEVADSLKPSQAVDTRVSQTGVLAKALCPWTFFFPWGSRGAMVSVVACYRSLTS